MGNAADHGSHCRQALALHNLLFELPLDGDIANGNNDAGNLSVGVDQLAARGAHGPPVSVAVFGAVFGGPDGFLAGNDSVAKRRQFRGMIFQVGNLLPDHIVGSAAEQVAGSRTDECITLVKIDDQDQIREAFQHSSAPVGAPSSVFRSYRPAFPDSG